MTPKIEAPNAAIEMDPGLERTDEDGESVMQGAAEVSGSSVPVRIPRVCLGDLLSHLTAIAVVALNLASLLNRHSVS